MEGNELLGYLEKLKEKASAIPGSMQSSMESFMSSSPKEGYDEETGGINVIGKRDNESFDITPQAEALRRLESVEEAVDDNPYMKSKNQSRRFSDLVRAFKGT